MSMSLANLVGIERACACTNSGADQGAFFAADDCAGSGAGDTRAQHREFVTMFLPEGPTMTPMTSGLCRPKRHCHKGKNQEYQKHCHESLHKFSVPIYDKTTPSNGDFRAYLE